MTMLTPLVGFIALVGLWLAPLTAMGRDLDGRYANSPLKPWFDQLKSRNGRMLFGCRRLRRRRRRLGSEERSLSRASAGGSRLRSHGLDRCARQFRHH
jgi:hypothetical protein